ncbi:unnamed protein product [Pipistrellus nathusii]|uniref:Uncharacterized protein n=1 Tax=Pipistrellus nathusii TaxID=59473 RepID=A0ABN9ZYQ6_PIPNA
MTRDCHKYFLLLAWEEEAGRPVCSGACTLSFRGLRGYLYSLWSGEIPATLLFFRVFVSWNATVLSVPPQPPAPRSHQSRTPGRTWSPPPFLGGKGPSPFLPFFHLIVLFCFCFSFTHNWLLSLREPGNKEPQAAILAGKSLYLASRPAPPPF